MNKRHHESFNTTFKRLLNLSMGLAIIDGGTVIAVQIITFLFAYFLILQSVAKLSSILIAVPLISILNLSVIIHRITWLTRGVKQNLVTSYIYSLGRWPLLILMYLITDTVLISVTKSIIKITGFNPQLIILTIFALIPYGLLACIFIVDQRKSPFQAIAATYSMIRHKLRLSLLITISAMYALPCLIAAQTATVKSAPYIILATALWLLFCHIFTIVVYVENLDKPEISDSSTTEKTTKVVII